MPPTPTPLNIWVLQKYLREHAGKIPIKVPNVDFQHLKRCLAAGLIEPDASKKFLVLTSEGMLAVGENDAEI